MIRTATPADADLLRALHRRSSYIWKEDRQHFDAHPDLFGVDPAALAAGQPRMTVVAATRTLRFYERNGFVVEGAAPTRFGPALRLARALSPSTPVRRPAGRGGGTARPR